MNIHKDINLFRYAEQAQKLLCTEGVRFNHWGFPDLTEFQYPKEVPCDIEIWPYNKRNQASNPKKTILTFFEADPLLYGYLNTLDKVTANLSLYYGVTGFDISPCLDFSLQEQKAALLLNSLTNGLFLLHGIRVIPSLRIGSVETSIGLKSYPRHICYALGVLGCRQKHLTVGEQILELKLALCEPSQVLAYGKFSKDDGKIFRKWGIPVLDVPDYQTRTRKKSEKRRRQDV